jgi:hypothetical protein
MIGNLIPIELVNGKAFFKEISFYEYKNICKMLMSTDIQDINDCLEYLLRENVTSTRSLNVVDKFKCLVSIRNTILGTEVSFMQNKARINVNLSTILDKKFENENIEYDILTLSSPGNFYSSSYGDYIAECLVAIKGNDVSELTFEQKKILLGETDLPLTDIYRKLLEVFGKRNIEIYKDINVNLYNQEYILSFLKNILYEDLFQVIEFEYACIRNLDFKANDFKNYTYPELKIFLNHLNKEKQDEKNAMKDR